MDGTDAPAPEAEAATESCVKRVDAIWFCYSPVYQTAQYYREGVFDSCLGKWSDLWDCMRLRTAAAPMIRAKRAAKEAEEREERGRREPVWVMRSEAEAKAFWEAEFGAKTRE